MPIPHNIRAQDVISAIAEADRAPWPTARNAKTHHLVHGGKLYPVKYIISLASKYAGNGELPPDNFISTESRDRLKRLGFKVESMPTGQASGTRAEDAESGANTCRIDGVTIYIRNTAKPSGVDTFRALQPADIDLDGQRDMDTETARARAYKDAYALVFAASKGEPVPTRGDKAVTTLFIKKGLLRFDTRTNTLRAGRGLPNLSTSGPERPGDKPGTVVQAVCTGVLEPAPTDDTLAQDLDAIVSDPRIDSTTRQSLIAARIGQGKFRRDVMARWEGACAFSGCMTEAVLRASHIKPWSESSNAERLDPANGLLLAANLDALFDRGLISFDDEGRVLVSARLSEGERALLHVGDGRLRGQLDARTRTYLAHHRRKFGFGPS